jgi:Outer membrane protein beta-barrel family/Carboxypeptidase regulatory-like domain
LKLLYLICLVLFSTVCYTQTTTGIITGNLLDEKQKALGNAAVELIPFADSILKRIVLTDKNGNFIFAGIGMGRYRLRFSFVGYQSLTIDSIYLRSERFDFNLNDIVLKPSTGKSLEEVIVYAEKPLIQSKEGNITFNAAESALSAGSTANELLKNVPLVTTDPNGKLLIRGKEPRILIDDKPVELNAQQLQDLLESLPGSSIEKIEVMTQPPPQYAGEQGSVINITTRKGKVGWGGRLTLSAGTRGEAGINGNMNYRKNKLAINFNAGIGYSQFSGEGYSKRQNNYPDSINYFNTVSDYLNKNYRPNARLNIDYDLNKRNTINLVLQTNQNNSDNSNTVEYENINRFREIYRLSTRAVHTRGDNNNQSGTVTYTHRGKRAGGLIRVIIGGNQSCQETNRNFFQRFFNGDYIFSGIDSTQRQFTRNRSKGWNGRMDYDKMLANKKTFLSAGIAFTHNNNDILLNTEFLKKPEFEFVKNNLLSNDFRFFQTVGRYRLSVKHLIGEIFSLVAGSSFEQTWIDFQLTKSDNVQNNYFNWLPFATVNSAWKNKLSFSLSYRKTLRRPGIAELNPSIDYADPYNLRFGNPFLKPSTAHNFDLVIGKTHAGYYWNIGSGYNSVADIYQFIRTLLPDGKTQATWDNISNRKEFELSTWSGITLSKNLRAHFSVSYTYNSYSSFDKQVNKYRDGGSLSSNLNSNYAHKDVWIYTGSFTFNRFGNPQGTVRNNISMNIGIQRKLLQKRLVITLNAVDPLFQQKNRTVIYGTNFNLENYSYTGTRNFRLTIGYNFSKKAGVKLVGKDVKKKTL